MQKAEAEALFTLANIKVMKMEETLNQSLPRNFTEDQKRNPWWRADTLRGFVTVGYSDSFVIIFWNDTTIRQIVTQNAVDKSDYYVVARTLAKAVEYLSTLSRLFMLQSMFSRVEYGEELNKMCLSCGVWSDHSVDRSGRCTECHTSFMDRLVVNDKTTEPESPLKVHRKFIGADWGITSRTRENNPCAEIPLTVAENEGIVLSSNPE
jgi:hypothetical protein